jgi:hypothetical protein
VLKQAKVKNDGGTDEDLEDHQKFALRLQVGLARFVNEFRNFPHRRMDGQVLQPLIDH